MLCLELHTCTQTHTHDHTHTQTGLSCPHWVLLFCLCPADGGSEHIQAKRFVSGSGETALLRAQSAPRRKHYLYPLSRSSLHRNSQYQPSPREWVCRTHVHTRIYYTVAVPFSPSLLLSLSFPLSHAHTFRTHKHCCTARGLRYFYSLWLWPLCLARCLCVCNFSSILFSLFSPFWTAPSPDQLFTSGLSWSGPNPVLVLVQSLICCSVLVSTGGDLLFSLCLRCPDRNGAGLFMKKMSHVWRRNLSHSKMLGSLQQSKQASSSSKSKWQLLLHVVLLSVCEWGQAWLLWPCCKHLLC